jgi:ABC-2 type transport system ATP-binding protein
VAQHAMGLISTQAESPLGAHASRESGDRRIVASGVTRRFGTKTALHPLSLEIGPGAVTGLLGPNGSGKSTFMRILTGLVRPNAGTAVVDGVPLKGDGTAIRKRVTYSPGELHLYGEMRGAEHLEWLLRGRGAPAQARALEMAGGMGLPLERRVRGYSHGMKRQLVFAAAMAPDVSVRILDEPTDGLDPSARSEVLERLRAEAARGTTILLSSHHLDEVDRVCSRLVFMNEGRLVADETTQDVRERASRLILFTWAQDVDLTGIESRLAGPGVESVRRDGPRVSVALASADPRAFLASFSALQDIPAPASIEHGRLSLKELYRELYGVEAC